MSAETNEAAPIVALPRSCASCGVTLPPRRGRPPLLCPPCAAAPTALRAVSVTTVIPNTAKLRANGREQGTPAVSLNSGVKRTLVRQTPARSGWNRTARST